MELIHSKERWRVDKLTPDRIVIRGARIALNSKLFATGISLTRFGVSNCSIVMINTSSRFQLFMTISCSSCFMLLYLCSE